MRTKRIVVSIVIITFFVIYWLICRQGGDNRGLELDNLYGMHGLGVGYFSFRSIWAVYVVPLLLFNGIMMGQEEDYLVIRYTMRKKVWCKRLRSLFLYNLLFTFFYFAVHVVLMSLFYSVSIIIRSRILLYLAIYFPVIFLSFSLMAMIFMTLQIHFDKWRALVFAFAFFVTSYFLMEMAVVSLFFMELLEKQIWGEITAKDVILSYGSIFIVDVIVAIVGLKLYDHKEFLLHEE